jgi:zona occludens toxin
MAITYIVGIPRSGKTYYVMYQLWKYFVYTPKDTKIIRFLSKFITPKHIHNYDLAYTNINQFDFTKTDKIKKLDFDDLYLKLSELYSMYMAKKTDDELIAKAKEFNLHNVLITIDEVHNFLGDKVDEVLKWWLTYHGHLHQDLFLITQDLSLVHTKYKANAEFFYRAIPPSARLSTKKFRYTQYRNSRMAMNGKISDFTIPAIQDIFNMYVSGAENNAKSIVKKFLYIGSFLSMFLFVGVYIFISSFKEDVPIDNNTTRLINDERFISPNKRFKILKNDKKTVSKDDKNKKELFEINCIKHICTYKKVDFPRLLLIKIINDNNDSFAYKVDNNSFTKYFVLIQKDTFNFLQIGGKENDKNKKNSKKKVKPTFKLL